VDHAICFLSLDHGWAGGGQERHFCLLPPESSESSAGENGKSRTRVQESGLTSCLATKVAGAAHVPREVSKNL
jgi:hypothetical protein